ncbi:UNVERIFIED_CONTAM: hypothetical protein Slati_2607900 [Sesamum latifolium]|uniref:FAF domain-containing protein n=1 Tax=Sesamum latifolium TaxID=2727402 RepID=A0AAW2VWF8_9LAMI
MYSPEFGDYIGVESAADLKSDIGGQPLGGGINHRRMRRQEEADREFPPPIPWLARTENQAPHMPWVMKKYYTGDGRLIIKEEKVKRHGFHAHRSNGRLVLNLVPSTASSRRTAKSFAPEKKRDLLLIHFPVRKPTVGMRGSWIRGWRKRFVIAVRIMLWE